MTDVLKDDMKYRSLMHVMNGWMDSNMSMKDMSKNLDEMYCKLKVRKEKEMFFQAIMHVCNLRAKNRQKQELQGQLGDMIGIMKNKFKELPG